jgi:hypothetical protein
MCSRECIFEVRFHDSWPKCCTPTLGLGKSRGCFFCHMAVAQCNMQLQKCDVYFETRLVETLPFVSNIAHSVVACSPSVAFVFLVDSQPSPVIHALFSNVSFGVTQCGACRPV